METPDKTNLVGHVDADSIMFNIGWGLSKGEVIPDEDYSHATEAPEVIHKLTESYIRKLKVEMGVEALHLHFTASDKNQMLFEEFYNKPMQPQFRTQLGGTYKSNRKAAPLPCGYHLVLRSLLMYPNAYLHDTWEADDAVLLHKKLNPDAVLSSNDKDVYKQHAGLNWLYDKRKKWEDIPVDYANFFAFYQAITGDVVDGFGGVPGIGPKRAGDFVRPDYTPSQNWQGVLDAFESKGQGEEEALFNMRMASMSQLFLDKDGKPFIDLWKPEGHHLEPIWSVTNE